MKISISEWENLISQNKANHKRYNEPATAPPKVIYRNKTPNREKNYYNINKRYRNEYELKKDYKNPKKNFSKPFDYHLGGSTNNLSNICSKQNLTLKIPFYDTNIIPHKKILYIELIQCQNSENHLVMKNFQDYNLFSNALKNFIELTGKNQAKRVDFEEDVLHKKEKYNGFLTEKNTFDFKGFYSEFHSIKGRSHSHSHSHHPHRSAHTQSSYHRDYREFPRSATIAPFRNTYQDDARGASRTPLSKLSKECQKFNLTPQLVYIPWPKYVNRSPQRQENLQGNLLINGQGNNLVPIGPNVDQ
jgi:hypothetical protein